MDRSDKIELIALLEEKRKREARKHVWDFAKHSFNGLKETPFHKNYYEILNAFAEGKIKRLIVSIPPQHGKTLGSSELLPAYMLGRNPDLRVAISSYSTTQARKFNRRIQRIIDNKDYNGVFPDTTLNDSNVVTVSSSYLRNADEFEIVGHEGSLKVVGRGGPLTGNPVDVMIMDDMYKDYQEGNSPLIRENVWDYYTSVVKTRLHNDSQELIVFTRWHEDDLIGRISKMYGITDIESLDDLNDIDPDKWVKVNFEALKTTEKTELDPREKGAALWPDKHSKEKLEQDRDLDPEKFNCLHQGNPISAAGLLYKTFNTYKELPELFERKNYTDTADTGKDYLCSISYGVNNGNYYVLDVLYTDKGMEYTEEYLPQRLIEHSIRHATIESNNGGRGFARVVKSKVMGHCAVDWFFQNKNKEARIITNSNLVSQHIYFPEDWAIRWPDFYNHLTRFKKLFKSNTQDGGPDVLTGIIEKNRVKSRRIFA